MVSFVFVDVSSLNVFSTLSGNIFFPFWIVNNLSFNRKILNSFPGSLDGLVFDDSLFNFLGNVFNLGFNSIVVSNRSFNWNPLVVHHLFIFHYFSFIRNPFYPFNFVVFNIFLLKWNVLYSALHWDLFSYCLLVHS